MSDWRKNIDADTARMLIRAASCQKQLGLESMVLDFANIKKRRAVLAANGSNPGRKVFRSLESHYKYMRDCNKCPLSETRTKLVYGDGSPHADIMFIGEAPGRDEDLQGVPFVGRAGQLLDKILTAINFSRDDIYIANILKCRPPNNRDPQPDEMAACMPHLQTQMKIIKPRLICALGRVAAQALLNTSTPLGKLRKDWHDYNGIPMLVTYHPAALLRFPSYKRDCWEDVLMLRSRYDEMMSGADHVS